HGVAVLRALPGEQIPRRHRDDAHSKRSPAVRRVAHQQLACADTDRDFGSGSDEHEVEPAIFVDQRVCAAGETVGSALAVPTSTGIFWRVSTIAVGPSPSMWTRQACATSLASAG